MFQIKKKCDEQNKQWKGKWQQRENGKKPLFEMSSGNNSTHSSSIANSALPL